MKCFSLIVFVLCFHLTAGASITIKTYSTKECSGTATSTSSFKTGECIAGIIYSCSGSTLRGQFYTGTSTDRWACATKSGNVSNIVTDICQTIQHGSIISAKTTSTCSAASFIGVSNIVLFVSI